MVRKQSAAAATKTDLIEAIQGLETRLDVKFDAKLDSKIGGLRTELKGEFGSMELNIRRLMAESVDTNERMRGMDNDLRQAMRDMDANVTGRLEAFTGRMETLWERTVTFPKILDEHGAALSGHHQRIKVLEARQFPSTPSADPFGPRP